MGSIKGGIAPFEATSLDDIQAKYDTLRKTYRTNRTKDFEFRKKQIRRLYWGLIDCAPLIEEALMKDMGKCKYEAHVTELEWCKTECVNVANKLDAWAKDEPVADLPLQYWPMKMRMRNEPLGTILMIGAYNYPYQLNITPLVGAIAAGNTVILKPSEHSPHSAMVLKKLFDEYLDPECYVCVNGALEETKFVMDLKFDKVVFTGGKKTGAIIATKAAQSLTPVLLELGGQNPAFLTKHSDLKLAARRLLWQKCLNAGQVCLSHNYVLIDRSLVSKFIGEVTAAYRTFMPQGAKKSPDFSRIVNKTHFDRIKAMVDNTKGKIVMGGDSDESEFFIEPTVVLVDSIDDSMMAEESFGPVWSIMPVDSLDEAIDIANKVDPTPLALYTFGSDAENKKVLENVTSGGATANDAFFHCMVNASPIGGIGSSGTGNYHGHYSFKAFSHQRCIATVPAWAEKVLRVRYMPYSWGELERYKKISAPKPNFDRDGNVVRGLKYWVGLVFGLGGKSASSAALRWGILIAVLSFLGLKRSSLGL
ncbi:Hexadecenal dehydrogenase, variant 2 [Purpureocillium takamizusanense]|uniref:Aldehyde dehydrogenase n=1 Tax=Purpureocillium takamizusanense TaxID=2060973 RepID=A0A9Q8QLG3_9HYPO|nr:Hexadecenal dehydrogenase, variant 2 [Purpureocillium takamizusanense]UNI20692.1 Hexadecenal dehydrogenase, variant 2 [Purpureocillium takamizusanense]